MTTKLELLATSWVWSDLPSHKIGYTSNIHHKLETVYLKLGSSRSPKHNKAVQASRSEQLLLSLLLHKHFSFSS